MIDLLALDSARPGQLRRDGACLREGVARSHGRERNWARTKPRTTTTTKARPLPQRWVEKVDRSITNSETPHPEGFVNGREVRNSDQYHACDPLSAATD
jgi:hypothetical protein